ncbi:predicted protein, partial [Nematostella vectensis]
MNGSTGSAIDFCRQPTQSSYVAQTVFLSVIFVITLLGNATVCLTVFLTSSLHAFTNYIVASLAVSDLMVALFSLPFRIHQTVHNTHWCLGASACAFWIWADMFCCCASIMNLALISLDRFLATKYPLNYQELINRAGKIAMVVTVWLYSFVVASLSLRNWTSPEGPLVKTINGCFKPDPYFYTFAAALGFFLPLIVIILAYSYVFRVAVGHWRAIGRLTVPAHSDTTTQRRALSREIKAAKTLAIVIGAFTLCWMPLFIIILATFWCTGCFKPQGDSNLAGFFMFVNITFVYTLPNINSTLNPLIYVLFSKKLRQAFVRM